MTSSPYQSSGRSTLRLRGRHMANEVRSRIMRAVRSTNTGPEMQLRSLLCNLGYRYRLHCKSLPGRPDVAMIGRRKAIFVHGCFWHQHPWCPKARPPKTRLDYWQPKLARNQERDVFVQGQLRKSGWGVLVIWQCEFRAEESVRTKLRSFLGRPSLSPKRRATNPAPSTSSSLVVRHRDRRWS